MSRLNELWHHGAEQDWEDAAQEYWSRPGVARQRELEERMDRVHESRAEILSSEDNFYRFLFEDLYPWKMDPTRIVPQQRNLEKYHMDTPAGIDRLRQYLLSSARKLGSLAVDKMFKRMTPVGGMGIPVASGCLAVLFPEYFGTLDRFCLRGFLTVDDDPATEFFRLTDEVVSNPDEFFGKYEQESRLHVAKLMTLLYRQKAESLNERFRTTAWIPRRIEKVVWTLRDQ